MGCTFIVTIPCPTASAEKIFDPIGSGHIDWPANNEKSSGKSQIALLKKDEKKTRPASPLEGGPDDKMITYQFENALQLTDEEKTRLIFHSFTNVLNVFLGMLYFGVCYSV
jgi:hypothetical protein